MIYEIYFANVNGVVYHATSSVHLVAFRLDDKHYEVDEPQYHVEKLLDDTLPFMHWII